MTALTPTENALVAYAILDEVNEMLSNGARIEDITRDIARAQVYATLATVPVKPTQDDISQAIGAALTDAGIFLAPSEEAAAAEAVGRLL